MAKGIMGSETQTDIHPRYVVIIVMGVSGTGKTTLATALAREWNMEFVEGDGLHSKANIEKMSSGRALDDQDREPWLERIREIMEQRTIQRPSCVGVRSEVKRECDGMVITCSALKKRYREILRGRLKLRTNQSQNPFTGAQRSSPLLATYFVYIKGCKEIIFPRLQEREGHYMKADMLESQFHDLESPEGEEDVIVVNAEDDTQSQVDRTKEKFTALAGEWFSEVFLQSECGQVQD